MILLAINMCPHDKNQLVASGLDLVTEFVLNFPRPLLVFTTRKGPRPYFSFYALSSKANAKTLCSKAISSLSAHCVWTKAKLSYLGLWALNNTSLRRSLQPQQPALGTLHRSSNRQKYTTVL